MGQRAGARRSVSAWMAGNSRARNSGKNPSRAACQGLSPSPDDDPNAAGVLLRTMSISVAGRPPAVGSTVKGSDPFQPEAETCRRSIGCWT